MSRIILSFTVLFFICFNSFSQNNVGIGTSSPTHQLHTTKGVRHESLKNKSFSMVMADSTGVLFVNSYVTANVDSAVVNTSIPDSSCTGVLSTINVSGWPTNIDPSNLAIEVNINHPYTYDLGIIAISPYNDTFVLAYGNGYGANFTNTVFFDKAINGIVAGSNPFDGDFLPLGYVGPLVPGCNTENATILNFASVGGGGSIDPNGTWKLLVRDLDFYTIFIGPPTGSDSGTFISWKLLNKVSNNPTVETYNNRYAKWQSGQLTASNNLIDTNGNLIINPSSNVGIGNLNPQQKLQVNGNSSFAATDYAVIGQNNQSSNFSNPQTRYSQGGLGTYDIIPFLPLTDVGVWGNAYTDWSTTPDGYGGVFSSTDSNGLVDKMVLLGGTLTNHAGIFMGGNVGIGTTSPSTNLQVVGTTQLDDLSVTNSLTTSGTGVTTLGGGGVSITSPLSITSSTPGVGKVLTSDALGNATWQNGLSVETDPEVSSASLNRVPYWNGSTLVDGPISITGTATNVTDLNVSGPLSISSGLPGTGKVLTSDAVGNATWQNPPATGITGSGTTAFIPRFATASSIANSIMQQNLTSNCIGINVAPLTIYRMYIYQQQIATNGDGQSSLFGYRTRDFQNDGTSYSQAFSNDATRGYNFWGDVYTFGTSGFNYNDYTRCGGVLGAEQSGAYWGSLGYKSSASLSYGVYGSAAYASGTGLLPSEELNGIGGGFFGTVGSVSKGSVAGQLNEGELFAAYNKGDVYTSGKTVELIETENEKVVPTYAVTSAELTVYNKGKVNLVNGEATINFGENYTSILGEAPVVTASPMGNCNGVYVTNVTKNGFTIKELNNGTNNIEVSWIAVGNRIDAKSATIPNMFTNSSFNRNLSEALFNDGDTKHAGKGMWWNGNEFKFGEMPASLNPPVDIEKKMQLEEEIKNRK